MDRKSILVLAVSFLVLMMWYPLMYRLYPPKPAPRGTNTLALATNRLETSKTTNRSAATTPATNTVPRLSAAPSPSWTKPTSEEQVLVFENDLARYTFTSHGGGIKLIELKKYPETVERHRKKRPAAAQVASLNTRAPIPVLSILGDEPLASDASFQLRKTDSSVIAEATYTNGLRLVKEFVLSSNYLFSAKVHWENTASNAVRIPVRECVLGTATPVNPYDTALMMGLYWYNGKTTEHIDQNWYANRTLGCVPGVPRSEYTSGDGQSNVVWSAVHNQFFTIAMIPKTPAPRVVARKIDMPLPSTDELKADSRMVAKPFGFEGAFVYPEHTLGPGQSHEQEFTIFAGPREYNTLARIGSDLENNLDLIMDFGGFIGFFAKALLLSLNGLHALSLSYGWAIIAITVIIKLLFWPLTNFSTRSMKRMAALQPQMKLIQDKYKDDPKKMNAKLMEYMKENRISPMSGCFPILLQIPVFFGFYKMLQSAIELRGASFLWARDLSQPDTIWLIPGLDFPVNPLPLIMGVTMLWQSHLTPPSPGMDPMQQKIMKYMPLMFIVFLYNFSAGLSLYWTVQNLLSIAQMKMTKSTDTNIKTPVKSAVHPRQSGNPKKRP